MQQSHVAFTFLEFGRLDCQEGKFEILVPNNRESRQTLMVSRYHLIVLFLNSMVYLILQSSFKNMFPNIVSLMNPLTAHAQWRELDRISVKHEYNY